jgi:site-specific DNA-methyltransferase (adenine-specific)
MRRNRMYDIIYADPPWKYNDRRNKHTRFCGGAMAHYPVLDYKKIARLNIQSITKEDAVLCLWATYPMLKEALYVMEKWGFKYKTQLFTWIKTNKNNGKPFFGIGYYTKSNAEVCLLGVKGQTLKPITNKISSVIISPREAHSKKPEEARYRIEQLWGDRDRIELFARGKHRGWDCWGNEVANDVNLKDLEEE